MPEPSSAPLISPIEAGSVCFEEKASEINIRNEILTRVDQLTPDMQERVLRFVASLSASTSPGESGAAMREFAGSLDAVSARQMIEAVEEDCERIDTSEW